MVMIRWVAWRKQVEFRVFKKVFRIPDTVDLDEIKARFDDDDATLTITMPKRVKGISGFNIEEEEKRVDSGDVSAAGEVEEESIQRGESDVQSENFETEIQKEEEFGEIMENKERENQVLEAEEKSFSGGVEEEEFGDKESQVLGEQQKDEEETGDDYLEKRHQIDEQDKIMECIEEEEEEEELADSNKESEDSSLRKPPDFEGRESHEQTRHDEQENSQHSETEIQREEEFGEREKDIEETDDYNLDKIHQIDEEDKIHQIEEQDEETIVADSNKENEDSRLRKLPDIQERDSHEHTRHEEQELDSHEQTRHEEQERVVEQQDSQAETKSNDFGCRAFEEIGEQKPDVTKSREMEKETIDDDDVGLSKVQEIEQPEIHNEASKKVEGETSGHERKKIVKMGVKNRDSKVAVDGKMGEGFRPNIDRTQVVAENDVRETETKAEEFESDKLKADEVDKIHELVEKKEDEVENAKVRRKSKDISVIKLQENEEQQSKGQKQQEKQEMIKELVEEKTPKAEANTGNDIPKPVHSKTGDKEKEEKKSVKMEIKTGEAKEEVDAKIGGGFAPNIAETETNFEELESDKPDSDEIDKIHKMVEKKEEEEENAKVGTQSEDISLTKLQEIGEQQIQGQKRHEKQEKINDLVEEQTLEEETNIGNDIPKPVQEIEEVQEVETLGKTDDVGKARKEKKKSVKMEINNEDVKEEVDEKMGQGFEPNVSETDTKAAEFESDKLEADEVYKIHALVEKKEDKEENAEVGRQNEDISLKELQEIEEQQFHGQKRHDKEEKIKEFVEEQTLEGETKIGNDIPKPVAERSEGKHKIQKKIQEDTKNQPEEYKENITETGKKTNDAGARKVQEIIRQQELDEPARSEKENKTRELVKSKTNDEEKEEKIAETKTKEQESYRPKLLREQEMIQELVEEKTNFSKNGKVREEEENAEKNTEFCDDDDDFSGKVRDIEQRDSDAVKGKEEKDITQALVMEEKVSDGGKGIIAVAKKKAENDKSKKVQEIDEQQLHEEDTCGKQFQKLIGEVSGHGEVEDVENEKKTTEAEKIIRDRTREAQEIEKTDSDVSVKYIKGTTIQELDENRAIYRNEREEEKKDEADTPEKIIGTKKQELVSLNNQLEQDNVEDGVKSQELVKEKIKDCEEEEGSAESKIKTDDDVVSKVQGIKEENWYKPKMEHVSKIKELVEEKTGDYEKQEEKETAESDIEAECGSLRKVDGIEEHELHEPKIHKERDKTRITATEEPSCQMEEKIVESMTIVGGENCSDKLESHEPKVHKECNKTRTTEAEEPNDEEEEKIVEPMTITENENSVDVQEIKKERPGKLESQQKPYKIQEVVEAGHDDRKEEHKEEKLTAKAELETEEESSKRVKEFEQQEYHGLKRSVIQDKMQETEEKEKIRGMEEKEIMERRTKTEDSSLRKVRDDEDPELYKPYKRKKEEKIQELVEIVTSDYREKVKKQDEAGRLVKEEAIDPNDKHTGEEDHNQCKDEIQKKNVIAKAELKTNEDSSEKVREIEKWDRDEMKRSMVLDKRHETEEKDKTRVMEENDIVERRTKAKDDSLRKNREDEDPELCRHGKEDRIQELEEKEISDHRGKVKKKDGDDILRSQETRELNLGEVDRHCKQKKIHQSVEDEKEEGKIENISEQGGKSEEIKNVVGEVIDPKDKHTGGEGEHEEKQRYEKIEKTKTKVEDMINDKVGENKEPESDKQDRYGKLDKLEGVLREGTSDRKKEEDHLVNDFATEIQETKKEESHETELHEKLDMLQDEEAEEVVVVAIDENKSSRKIQTIKEEELEELEKHKEQNKIPETSGYELKEKDEERVAEKETKELEAHVQELEGKENCKDDDGEGSIGEKVKQGKIVETMSCERFKTKSDDGIVGKIQETKVEESNEKKNQELKGKIEELERKKSSNHEVKLVNEDDSLRKGQEFSEMESNVSKRRVDEEKSEAKIDDGDSKEKGEQKKIRQPMEEISNAPEKEKEGNEKIAEEEMKDTTDSRIKDQGQEPYELMKNGEHDKNPDYHKEEEKQTEQREIEEIKRKAEDNSSRKVQQIEALEPYELEKHRKLSEIQESSNIKESVEKETLKHREEEMNESGGYNAVFKKKSMASSETQDVEEKGSNQPNRYAEQELMTEEERKEEYRIREGEQKEKAKRMSQVDSIANDDSSKRNHQELVEIETIDQRKEELEEDSVFGKAETIDGYDRSRTIHEHEERNSDKLERHGEEEMSKKLAEQGTSDDKAGKEGNRAGGVWEEVETKIRGESFGKVSEIEEQVKKQSYVEKDMSGKSKENKNHETKMRDDSSGNKTQTNEKQESHEQKRNEDEVAEKEETIEEHDSSRKIHEHDERKSYKMSENIAEEETNDDKESKEGNRAGAVLGEVEKVREIQKHEQDKKQSFVNTSGKAKENKNQETKTRHDSAGSKTQKQESRKKKSHDEQDKKNLGLLGEKTNCCRNEDDVKEDKEISEAEVSRKLKGIEKRDLTKMVERHENGDDIKELVEEKMNNKEGEDKKSIVKDVLAKAEDDELKGPEELRKQDKSREKELRDSLKYEETSTTETKRKDNESRKIHQIKEEETNEQERLKEQGRINELVEDRTHYCREKENKETEFEDGSSKKIQDRDKEESIEPGRNEKPDKIQEPVDRETSEDDEEELEIEFEDEEEDWEAEVIQETDSDEDNDKIRQIKRIRLGFRLVGGSTLFMSLIVIVISFIRSKRKLRCYKF